MFFTGVQYDEPLFRPPGEAMSAIIQATIGCSWNKCAFCEMYTSKQFRVKAFDQIKNDISILANSYKGVRKIFLADGNAFVLSANKLLTILAEINKQFGKIQRVASYALPKDILNKTTSELQELKANGLKLLYVGIETGDDNLLKLIHKGETYNSIIDGILMAHNAGIDTSIMIINGLGGRMYSQDHAIKSAEIINKINPKFLSTLTLSMPYGQQHFQKRFKGFYEQQSVLELFQELKLFVENLNVVGTIYRSDHISNNLVLKGTFPKDKEALVETLTTAIKNTDPLLFPAGRSVL